MDPMRIRLAYWTALALSACSSVEVPADESGTALTSPATSNASSATSSATDDDGDVGSVSDSQNGSTGGLVTSTDPTAPPQTTADDDAGTTAAGTTGIFPSDDTGETGTTADPTGTVPPGSTVPFDGKDYFLLGANYPWRNYGGDFGGNGWGVYGVHTDYGGYDGDFAAMTDAHLEVIRWFVFTDGRAGIVFDNSGTPVSLGEYVLDDFDAALGIAKQRGAYLVPVLLDFHWMFWAKQEGPVQVGGRSDTITDPIKRAALVNNVFIPLFDKYAGDPNILAWEIMNEPEWSLSDVPEGQPDGQANAVPLEAFYDLSRATAEAVHAHAGAYVTLGSASLKWIKIWTPGFAASKGWNPIPLDFYQVHYYGWMDGQAWNDHPVYGSLKFSPMEQPYDALGLDHPLVVGELVISDNAGGRLDTLKSNGYAGAWPWSLKSDYSLDLPGLKAWAEGNAPLVDLP